MANNPLDANDLTLASNTYGVVSLLKNLLPLFAIYAVAPFLADLSIALAWCLAPLIGLLIYRLTMVMHDCGHNSLYTSSKVNSLVGMFLGAITGIDFECFKLRHWEHHKNYGKPNDPQGFHYLGIGQMTSKEYLLHSIKPLLGLNLQHVFTESYLHPANLKRTLRNGQFFLLIFCQLGILILVTGSGRHIWLGVLPVFSAATFGLFYSQLRGIAEHGVCGDDIEAGFVRSHQREILGAIFLYDVHFNFHKEHHEQPHIPSCKLPLLAHRALSEGKMESSMWKTLVNLHARG